MCLNREFHVRYVVGQSNTLSTAAHQFQRVKDSVHILQSEESYVKLFVA